MIKELLIEHKAALLKIIELNERNAVLEPTLPANAESIQELEAEKQHIAELEAKYALVLTEAQSHDRGKKDTSAATIAGLKKDIDSWKCAVPVAVKATQACMTDGEKKRKRPQLWAIWGEGGGELKANGYPKNNTRFEAWRDTLPDAHKDANDRASSYPLNNDGSLTI